MKNSVFIVYVWEAPQQQYILNKISTGYVDRQNEKQLN